MKEGHYVIMTKCRRLRYRIRKATGKNCWKHISVIDYIPFEMAGNEEKFFFSLFHKTSKKA